MQEREFDFTQRDFDFLRKISNQHTGIVVSDDKYDMFYSRLAKRVRQLRLGDFREYCEYLDRNRGEEFDHFINAITTNLTSFFRENHHFQFLKNDVLKKLEQSNAGQRRIRIWSAGCSTGEEPYSIAMTVAESGLRERGWDIRILATDIDSNVLDTAAQGVYRDEKVGDLPKSVLRKWFRQGSGSKQGYVRVVPELRQMISFKQLNLMEAWPHKGPLDVIFCRNVLIYFDSATKHKLVNRYADMLAVGGHLCIGHSESLKEVPANLDFIGHTTYRRKG